jgi:hypothetical protein
MPKRVREQYGANRNVVSGRALVGGSWFAVSLCVVVNLSVFVQEVI